MPLRIADAARQIGRAADEVSVDVVGMIFALPRRNHRDAYDSMGTVHPIFEMNLPEGALLEKLRTRFAKTVPDFDSLALLAIVGRSQIGRLRYAVTGHTPDEVPAEDLARILAHRGAGDLFVDLLERYATVSGISGVQPKVLVRAEETDLPRATHRGATHIIKSFDPREYPR